MHIADYTRKLLALSQALHRWLAALTALDQERRGKVADYAEQVAATLSRAAEALARLEAEPGDARAARNVQRELGRISGYVETMVGVLQHHLDGRKLAGVRRRLEQLEVDEAGWREPRRPGRPRIDRLLAAEGYFRALADGLRT